jgi:hypothetical protein
MSKTVPQLGEPGNELIGTAALLGGHRKVLEKSGKTNRVPQKTRVAEFMFTAYQKTPQADNSDLAAHLLPDPTSLY